MFHIEDVLLLKDGEQVKAFTRRHVITLFPGLLLALVLIVLPFFLLFPLFSWGIPGVALFAIAILAGMCITIRTLLLWDADVLIVSNFRIVDVDQKGLFTRIVSEAPITSVQDVSWEKKGFLETFFRIGSVRIQTAGGGVTITAVRIPHPQEIHELINDLRHSASPATRAEPPSSPDKLKSISSLLEKYSPDELARIESVLKARERSALVDAFLTKDDQETA